jgi:branched-chain amino acid transport system substrate-binding protein
VLLSATLLACSSMPKPKKSVKRFPDYGYQEQPSKELAERMPWELWQPFQDLKGGQLSNKPLILGDELQQQGKRQSALDTYLSVDTGSLEPTAAEAAVIRIASQQLALDNPKKALSTVGSYFKRRGMSESEVDVPFGLLLAFAYGRHGDIDQSLAWFSKVSAQGRPGGPAVKAASFGAAMLLRTLSNEQFENAATNWRSDTFITDYVGRERFRRSSPGYDPDDVSRDRPFWLGYADGALSDQGGAVAQPGKGAQLSAGLIVSLSDRFGALGRDTKQGFELAIEANNPAIVVEARDVGADTAAASAAVRELVSASKVSVIAGPLLTEAAVAAAQTAQEVGVPLLSFSKSESFRTGGLIFRLGATTTSQVDALVNSAFGEHGITRFAIAYPQSGAGTEFLEAFRRKLEPLGLALELEVPYSSNDDASLMEVAQRLEGTSVEAVLIPDGIEVSERLLRQLTPSFRKRVRPLGTALWDNAAKISRSQALFERAIFVTPFFSQSTREEVSKFIASYRGKFSSTPNFLAAQGFDAGTLISRALTDAVKSGDSFDKALLRLAPYRGITGAIAIDSSGEIARKFYVVEVLRDSFQESMPPSNPSSVAARATRLGQSQPAGTPSNTPILGADERVDSGY